jgi:hypothetical protein
MTAVAGTVFTAAQWNVHVRNNLNACAPGVATAGARWIVSTGFNALTERAPDVDYISTSQSTTSSSYGDLGTVGPTVTATTSTWVLVTIGATISNSTASAGGKVSVNVSGASSLTANDNNCFYSTSGSGTDAFKGTWTTLFNEGMTAGQNIFQLQYRSSGGGTAFFSQRLLVIASF